MGSHDRNECIGRIVNRQNFVATTGALLGLGLAIPASIAGPTLSGAGASFPAAIYLRWFQDLSKQWILMNYQSVGSGAGIRQFTANSVDFGASDVPMTAKEIAAVKDGVVQIPMTAGAIAVAYNNPGCKLKLSQTQLAQIFLGTVSNFSQLGCKALPIKIVHRADGSGTTANFTAHLSAISPAWKKGPGESKSISWPTGIGAKGNEGVASQLAQVQGSIGYVEVAFVKGNLQAASLTNASGQIVAPSKESEKLALSSIDLGNQLTGSNPNPAKGYPIVNFTWILLNKKGNGDKLDGLKKAFTYTLSDKAQAVAPSLGFISLPPSVLAKGRKALAGIEK